MNRTIIKKIISAIVLIACVIALSAGCSSPVLSTSGDTGALFADDPGVSTQRKAVIRVGCFRGEDYSYWNDELKAMGSELHRNRVITGYQARNYESMDETWAALAGSEGTSSRGELKFVEEYFFTLDEMDDTDLEAMLAINDLDVMLTFGTAAGKYMTNHADRISYDYMVFGATNTVNSHIVKSETERYNDHAFALVDVNETKRTLQAAYDLFKFKDIGVVYEDNDDARVYSGIDVLEDMSEQYGFTIHTVFVDESTGPEDDERYYSEVKAAYDSLQPEIDTLFITTSTMADEMIPYLLSDIIDAGVITISQESSEQCQMGALMHLQVADAEGDGMFMAKTLSDYSAGVPITELPMVYVGEPRLFLNYETIVRTGVKVPMKAYMIADTIYGTEGDR